MSKNMLILATEYKAMKAKEEQLKIEMDALKAEMISAMNGEQQVVCGQYKITYQTIVSNVINTKALEKDFPELVKDYRTEKETKRFTVV